MRKTIQLLSSLAVITIYSCKKDPPKACVTTDKSSYKVNEPVKFDAACSEQCYYYSFVYSNGTMVQKYAKEGEAIADDQDFLTAGSYTLTLTVSTKNKKESDQTSLAFTIIP